MAESVQSNLLIKPNSALRHSQGRWRVVFHFVAVCPARDRASRRLAPAKKGLVVDASVQIPSQAAVNHPELVWSAGNGLRNPSVSLAGPALHTGASVRVYAVTIAIAIAADAVRDHIVSVLGEAEAAINAKSSLAVTRSVQILGDQSNVLDWLQGYFLATREQPLVLISDMLKPPDDPTDGFLTRECQKRFSDCAMGTVAILPSQERVIDIDRTIRPDVSHDDLVHAMLMLLGRIEYLMAPAKHPPVDARSIVVRPLRNGNEAEFQSYFQMRHYVYSQMGYLREAIESSQARLEMNEADVHSLHLGAFCRRGCRDLLVGSARVVTNNGADPALIDLFEKIAEHDPVSRQSLKQPYPLGLPIFHTYRQMTPIIREIFSKRQKCGELSRVIVDQEFRGQGIAGRLIAAALQRAVSRGLTRIFLECLRIHESLYEMHGFKRIPGFEATVIDVKRTMIAMELQPEIIAKISQGLA